MIAVDISEQGDKKRDYGQTCEECKIKEAIYQCPRCNIRTCSLECVRTHKTKTDCNGKRNREAFLPLCRMSDSSLRSDYFFLEEVLDRMPRDAKRAKTQHQTSRKSRRLLQQCEKRGINLKIMPTMMDRHKKNASWYCVKRDTIMWKVEVILHRSRKSFSCQLSEDEAEIISHLQKHAQKTGLSIDDSMRLFVKELPAPTNKQRYAEIEPIDNLRSFLSGMTIIEHPTIYCVDKDFVAEFPTVNDKIKELPSGSNDNTDTNANIVDSDTKMNVSIEHVEHANGDGGMIQEEPNENNTTVMKAEASEFMTEVSSKSRNTMIEDSPKESDTLEQGSPTDNRVTIDASVGC
ncbi:unnamed protein product [Cylindrotheca closterium]|uniref:Box C/D snoRNA protein 1 n=1 Tax=Cylindrotheca closterium TaxID=2856 RepID=A0AAD2JJI6_9STRA|nr:unnamed protein product [Cylindrotheca closterium]